MSDPIIFWPDAQPLSIQIATWNTSTLAQEWHEVAQFCPVPGGLQLGTRPAQGGVADGTLALEIPIIEDSYNFEAWNEVRISGTVAGPPVGGYPRHFRGYALKRDSHTDGLENLYSFQLIDGWMRVEKPPATLVDERTWRGEDHQIIHAMAYTCWPDLYPSGAATPAAPTTAPSTTAHTTGGTLTAGKWRVAYAWSNPSGPTALSASAIPVITGSTGSITVTIPGTLPAGATGGQLYVAADADALDRVWYADVAGPGTYLITDPPTGSLPPLAAILPYPTAPHTDQPNVNNYSSVQTPVFGPLTVSTKAATLAQALQAVQEAVPADYEVPRAMLWWKPDNAAHTAGWDWQLTWLRDTDTPIYGIVAINVNYTQPEDATHTFYYSMQRSRDGGPVGNVQTVQGDWIEASGRYATATVSSSVSYQEIGVYLSLPPVIDRDLKTDADCAAHARQLLDAAKLVQETLANVVTYTPYPILGATRVRVYNQYEGGLDDPVEANLPVYTIAHAAATYTEAGLEYQLELGAGFAELGEARTRFKGGSGTTTSSAPPAVPQWHETPADDIVSNTYDPVSHLSTLIAAWLPDLTGLITDYEARYSWDGGTTWAGPVSAPPANPPTITLVNTPGASVTIQVRAHNTHNVISDWSAPRTIALASREAPAAPVWDSAYTATPISATQGTAGPTWTDGAGGTGTPAQWRVIVNAGSSDMQFLVTTRAILLTVLLGVSYTVTVQAGTAYDDWGPVSAPKTIVVAHDAPGPPTLSVTGITPAVSDRGGAGILLSIAKPTTGTGLSRIARYEVTGDWRDSSGTVVGKLSQFYTYTGDPTTGSLLGLTAGRTYYLRVVALTLYGDVGTVSSDVVYTIIPTFAHLIYNADFEIPSTLDPTQPDGWALTVTGGTATLARDTTTFKSGSASARISWAAGAGNSGYILSDPFVLQGDQTTFLNYAVRSDDATHAVSVWPTILFYDSSGAVLGNDSGVIYHPTTTGWEGAGATMTAPVPAGTAYARLRMNVNNLPLTKQVWFDNLFFSAQSTTTAYQDTSVTYAKLSADVQAALGGTPSAQTANTVLAGPASGSPATPTYRALVDGDLPPGWVKNPMGAPDDLIMGGTSGTPVVLHKGANGTYLGVDATTGHLVYSVPPASGFTNPMTAQDDLIIGALGGSGARLGVGASGTYLGVDGAGHLAYSTPPGTGVAAFAVVFTNTDGDVALTNDGRIVTARI